MTVPLPIETFRPLLLAPAICTYWPIRMKTSDPIRQPSIRRYQARRRVYDGMWLITWFVAYLISAATIVLMLLPYHFRLAFPALCNGCFSDSHRRDLKSGIIIVGKNLQLLFPEPHCGALKGGIIIPFCYKRLKPLCPGIHNRQMLICGLSVDSR